MGETKVYMLVRRWLSGRKSIKNTIFNKNVSGVNDFLRLDALVRREHLYKDSQLDRSAICDRLGIERHALNQLLNDYAGGLSVPAYINRVRLEVACELLKECPEKSLTDIAAEVGMSPQNFRVQFKNHYGMTPTEFRQA